MLLARVLIYLISFLSTISVFSQEHTHRFYTVYDGLPQSQVWCVAQDCTGYIWAGTKGGIARFDGHKFEAFTTNDGLVSNLISKILPTDSCIWFFSPQGITKFQNQKFIGYKAPSVGVNFAGIVAGKMVFNTFENKNVFFDGEKFIPHKWNPPFSDTNCYSQIEYVSQKDIYLVIAVQKGLYALTKSNAICIYPDGMQFIFVGDELVFRAPETPYHFNYLKCNLETFQTKLLELNNYQRKEDIVVSVIKRQPFIINGNQVGLIEQNNVALFHKKFNLPTTLFIDNKQNYWVADEDGLYFFNKLEFTEYTKQNSQCPSYVWDIKEFPKGKIWFAGYGSGLFCWDGNSFNEELVLKDKAGIPMKNFYFNSPIPNDSFMILNSTPYPSQIFKNKTYKPFIEMIGAPLVTFYDSIRNEYLITSDGRELRIKKPNGNTFIYKGSEQTFSRNILDITYDKNGDICLGHRGLTKFKNREFINYPNIPDSLTWRVFSLQKDHKGNLWLGTDQGLWFYNYDTIFNIENKNFNGPVTFLEMVDTNWLMGGTTLGLPLLYLPEFYKTGEQRVKFYDRFNGFTGRDCGQNGTLHDSENTFWIPTIDRVLRLDPTKIAFDTIPPTVIFKGISLLGENLSWTFMGDTIRKFDYTQNGLNFSYVGLNYSAPERVKYKYRLIGYSDFWSNETKEREAIFTNLKPGRYSFEILACNEDGYWTLNPVKYEFRIIPAWWQRIWVQILFFLALIGIITYATILIMRRRNALQREKLETRNQMLNMSLSTIKNQMDPHFTYNALNGIESLIMKEDRSTAYQYLLKLSGLIRNTLNDNDLINRSLADELKFVTDYLELEKFRFKDKFEYQLVVDPKVDLKITVPKLIIQIFVENAIKHGLMHREKEGLLQILLTSESDRQVIVIQDNGIGRTRAKEFAIHSTGKGLNIIRKLIRIFNEQNSHQIAFQIVDLFNDMEEPLGTKVEVTIKRC